MAEFKIDITGDASGVVAAADQAQGALEKTEKATDQVTGAKKKLGDVLKTLGSEFPILGSLGRAAMNPIVGAVTLAVIGFRVLADHIKTLDAAFESANWDSYTTVFAKQKQALQEAAISAGQFANEIRRIQTEATTAAEESEKLMQVYKARDSAQDRLDAASKRLEIARAGGEKDPVKRMQKELDIEERYAQRKTKREIEASQFQIQEQHRTLANEHFRGEAIDRQLEKAMERQLSLKSEAAIVEQLRVEEQRMESTREEFTRKRDRVQALKEKPWNALSTPQMAERDLLSESLPGIQTTLLKQEATVNRLRKGAPGAIIAARSASSEVSELEAQRKANIGRQLSIYDQLPTQEKIAQMNQRAARGEGVMDSATRARTALNQGEALQAQLNQEIVQDVQQRNKGVEGMIRLYIEGRQATAALNETVRQLESQVSKLR